MGVRSGSDGRRALSRSRWAAIGAAIAVTLGGGGIFVANAASSVPSTVVTIDPVRILDTRTDVGLTGPFVSPESQKLQVTGAAVPAGATGVLLNVTVVSPTANGFLSIRPGDATGAPSTSSLNVNAGDIVPNAVQVGLPTSGANAGKIDITFDAYGVAGPTTEVLIDVVGYMIAGGAGTPGPAGQTGATGPTGPQGAAGLSGLASIGQFTPTQIIHGAVLTCTNPSTSALATSCNGVKVNGLDVRVGPALDAICDMVTGKGPAGVSGNLPSTATFFDWDGSTWVLGTDPASGRLSGFGCWRV